MFRALVQDMRFVHFHGVSVQYYNTFLVTYIYLSRCWCEMISMKKSRGNYFAFTPWWCCKN